MKIALTTPPHASSVERCRFEVEEEEDEVPEEEMGDDDPMASSVYRMLLSKKREVNFILKAS